MSDLPPDTGMDGRGGLPPAPSGSPRPQPCNVLRPDHFRRVNQRREKAGRIIQLLEEYRDDIKQSHGFGEPALRFHHEECLLVTDEDSIYVSLAAIIDALEAHRGEQ